MIKLLSTAIITCLFFLLSISNIHAFALPDSTGVLTWKEMMDSCNTYQQAQDYQTALNWAKISLKLIEKEKGKIDSIFEENLAIISAIYYKLGKLDSALIYGEQCLQVSRYLFKTNHLGLSNAIWNLAYLYIAQDDFINAEKLLIEALDMRRQIYKTDHINIAYLLIHLGTLYFKCAQYDKAEVIIWESIEMYSRIYKSDHPDIANNIRWLGLCYKRLGDYYRAEKYLVDALDMSKRIYKSDHYNLGLCLNDLADFYSAIGNFNKSKELYNEALDMFKRIYKTDHLNLASSIHRMAGFYLSVREYSKAESLFTESLEMFERIYKSDHPSLAQGIYGLAYYYHTVGNYSKAELLYNKALKMQKHIFKTNHSVLASILNNLGALYRTIGEYSKAEVTIIEGLKMDKELYKYKHDDLARSNINLADLYFAKGEIDKAKVYYNEALEIYKDTHNNYSIYLSESEKEKFWKKKVLQFYRYYSFAILISKENPEILSYAYDNLLFTKSLQYNTASRIKKRILESGDSELISKYNELTSKKDQLIKLYSLPTKKVEKQGYNIDSLENIANNLEKELSLKSEDFKQSYEKKVVTWKSIQPFLKPDEAAVEVVRFQYFDKSRWTDTVYYAFLIVNDETIDHPDIVVLENGNELEGDSYNLYRKFISKKIPDNASFNKYWAKVYEKLKNYKKIYLSADGIYNKINLSTIMMPGGQYLLDVQEIQLLNSTKDLQLGYYKKQDESSVYNSAVLIGNPNFSLSDQLVKEASQKIIKEEDEKYYNENLAATRGITLTSLPGTEKEIKDIEKFLKGKNWIVKSYLGDMALKAAVKSANSPRVLHIATHGMFLEDVQSDNKVAFGFEEKKLVENPLLRSGMFFTGADNYLKPDTTRTFVENNGLLTAYEAMNLNLDKTELVVLSACETGLGEIQNGEGVFGLRRAFQQAGAKTIIMSLWKVSDDATQELMSTFYKEWLGGKTPREAFKTAQMRLKEKYIYPYFWGAFVMVGE